MNQTRRRGPIRRSAPYLIILALLGYFLGDGVIPGLGGDAERSSLIKGRVVSGPDGVPLRDAVVRLGRVTKRTDADGRFQIEPDPVVDRDVSITIEKAGFAPQSINRRLEGGTVDVGEMPLDRELFLQGRLTSAGHEAPVELCTVRVEGGGEVHETVTNENGEYRVGPIREGRRYRVRMDHPSYVPFESSVAMRSGSDTVRMSRCLAPGAVISGRVVNATGKPLAGVSVIVRSAAGGPDARRATTDPNGNFVVTGLAAGEAVVAIAGDDAGDPVHVTVTAGGERTGVRLESRSQ